MPKMAEMPPEFRDHRLHTRSARNGLPLATSPFIMDFQILVGRVQSEFTEMPDLRLTLAQASRLLGIDKDACQHVIDALVRAAFLRWAPGGTIVRVSS
jgi:hypothetical protein